MDRASEKTIEEEKGKGFEPGRQSLLIDHFFLTIWIINPCYHG